MCEYLDETEKWQRQNYRILTDIDFGAEILYRTRHEVIGTPYHRNSKGILDTYDIMTAETDEEALEIIQRRGIDLILLCPKSIESALYSKPEQSTNFYRRLCEDTIPNWLKKVELPSDLSSSFILFETIEEKQLAKTANGCCNLNEIDLNIMGIQVLRKVSVMYKWEIPFNSI
jgi:hypothetical protein